MTGNIIFIGFMGAGKTSVGRAVSRRFHMDFLDTDEYIEEKAGMSVSEIFRTAGEDGFRRMETEALQALEKEAENCVISAGGGLPLREENRELLKKLGTVIYLKVSPETVKERLKGDTTRPLLAGPDPEKKIRELLEYREPLYEQAAHYIVDVNGRAPEATGEEAAQKAGIGIWERQRSRKQVEWEDEDISIKRTEYQFRGDPGKGHLRDKGLCLAEKYAGRKGGQGRT